MHTCPNYKALRVRESWTILPKKHVGKIFQGYIIWFIMTTSHVRTMFFFTFSTVAFSNQWCHDPTHHSIWVKWKRCHFGSVSTLWSWIKSLTKARKALRSRTFRNVLYTIDTFRTVQLHKAVLSQVVRKTLWSWMVLKVLITQGTFRTVRLRGCKELFELSGFADARNFSNCPRSRMQGTFRTVRLRGAFPCDPAFSQMRNLNWFRNVHRVCSAKLTNFSHSLYNEGWPRAYICVCVCIAKPD